MKWTRTRMASALAVGTASALVLSACGGGEPEEVSHEKVTLTVAYWGNFGFTEDAKGPSLESVYEADHPWVTLEMNVTEYGAAKTNLEQALIAGSGAANVAAIDEGWVTGFVAQADDFVNLLDLGAGQYEERYLGWKWDAAANGDGSVVIGLGSDVGGLAMCYRADLFDAAGITSDRDEVSARIGDSWDDFIEFGLEYVEGSGGKKFVDNATNILNPAITQLGTGQSYYNRNNELDMPGVKPAFQIALDVIDAGLSKGAPAWQPEWNAGFANGDFAVLACPAWMLGYIKSQIPVEEFTGQWDVADIPGPGGNWGGSYYTIPKQGTANEQQEAYNFIEWIIQGDQQLKIMSEVGNLPSQKTLLADPAIAGFSDDFFNGAPTGSIFAKSALDIPVGVYYAPNNQNIRDAVEAVLNDVQNGNVTSADAWDVAVAAAEAADV